MKKYATKLIGTQVYWGSGNDYIIPNYELANDYEEKPFDAVVDPNEIFVLANGMAVVVDQDGDEQCSTDVFIVKDWRTEIVSEDLPAFDKERWQEIFGNYNTGGNYIPERVRELLK